MGFYGIQRLKLGKLCRGHYRGVSHHYEINNWLWCGLQWLTVAYNDDLPESITPNMYVVPSPPIMEFSIIFFNPSPMNIFLHSTGDNLACSRAP